MTRGGIVFGGVADANGFVAVCSEEHFVENVINELLETKAIDFTVDHKKSLSSTGKTRGHTIQYMVEEEMLFISSARDGFPQRICFAFLQRLKDSFFMQFRVDGKIKKSDLQAFLTTEMDFFSNNPEADKLRGLQSKVDQIKDIMHENVEKMLVRGEKIESIEDKAEDLRKTTKAFDKVTKKVRCAMCRENVKMTICLAITLVVALVLIVGVVFAVIEVAFKWPIKW